MHGADVLLSNAKELNAALAHDGGHGGIEGREHAAVDGGCDGGDHGGGDELGFGPVPAHQSEVRGASQRENELIVLTELQTHNFLFKKRQ